MKKGDELAARAVERFFVDQSYPGAGSLAELAFHIVRAEGDVMNAASGIFLEEWPDPVTEQRCRDGQFLLS